MPALLQPQRAVAPPTPQHVLVKAVTQLYDLTGNVEEIVHEYYSEAPEVRFNDPLVNVTGRPDVCGQFRGLQGAFRLAGAGVAVRGVTYGERRVVLDWRITYVLRGVPAALEPLCAVTLPCLTVLTLEEKTGRVLHHDDHWSVHELVGGLPVVGRLYRGLKRVTGKATSVLANLAWAAAAAAAKTSSTSTAGGGGDAIASPSSTAMGSLGSAAPPSEATLAGSSPSVGRSARGISSASTIASAGSGARSSIASSGLGEEEKVLLAASD